MANYYKTAKEALDDRVAQIREAARKLSEYADLLESVDRPDWGDVGSAGQVAEEARATSRFLRTHEAWRK